MYTIFRIPGIEFRPRRIIILPLKEEEKAITSDGKSIEDLTSLFGF